MKLKMNKKIYIFLQRGLMGRCLKVINRMIRKVIGDTKFYEYTFGWVIRRITCTTFNMDIAGDTNYWIYGMETKESPFVSIIVPCYNHAEYLRKRLDTIYNQTYTNYEVILLDDQSTDGSQSIIREYAEKYPDNTRVCLNEKNGGRPFLQWKKGMDMSNGDLVWIAESDDWCELNYLEEMIKPFSDASVLIAFSNMMKEFNNKQNEHFMNSADSYSVTAATFAKNGFYYECILMNVSGILFRRPAVIPDEVIDLCSNIKVASDWLFYLWISKGGCIAHVANTVNYHIIHRRGTSYQYAGTETYFTEHKKIAFYIASNFVTTEDWSEKFLELLYIQYEINKKNLDYVLELEVDKLQMQRKTRRPNITIACFSLQPGGGETFPIHIANVLYSLGYTVTLIDFNLGDYRDEIRRILLQGIPLVRLKSVSDLGIVLQQLQCDIIHSHHGVVDKLISELLIQTKLPCRHIITLHGMYETLLPYSLKDVLEKTGKTCSKYVYLTEKNLTPFKKNGYYSEDRFKKIENGLPIEMQNEQERTQFGIDKEDFVLCIASRGIREKGWEEAINAVIKINTYSNRKVHLCILGDGEMKDILEATAPEFIHFMGVRNDVRSFFLMADAGILPTYFGGESYPLMLIECIQSNKPVIATNIAAIPNMILDEKGNRAGILVPIKGLKADEEALEQAIFELVTNQSLYEELKANCITVAQKFDMNKVVGKYLKVYWDAYQEGMREKKVERNE